MKFKFLSLVVILIASSALSYASDCPNKELYVKEGWVVHNSDEFGIINKKILNKIDSGTKANTLGYDLYAIYNFDFGVSGDKKDFIAEMNTWDDYTTNKDEMWGDIAIYTNFDHNSTPVEIHWYEGGKRHIVTNPQEVECINMPPTSTINSVY